MVPATGIDTFFKVVIPLVTAKIEPNATSVAKVIETILNSPISSSNFGNRTIIVAPKIAPKRDLRPPIIIPNKNRTVSSLL